MVITLSCLTFNKPNLVIVDASTKLNDVLSLMQQNNITSVVVEKNGDFLGFVTTIEIMTEIAFGSFEWDHPKPEEFELFKSSDKTVETLLNMNHKTQQIHYYQDSDMLQNVFEPMGRGIRRVLVKSKFNQYRLISQTDVVAYVATHLDLLKIHIDTNQTVGELQLASDPPTKPIWKLATSESAINGFRFLTLKNILSAPIVNERDEIISTLSASDLRGLKSDNLKSVLTPVLDYLKTVNGGHFHPVTCTLNDSLQMVILKLTTARIKRIWVVNSAQQPIGAISLRSIISLFNSCYKI